jgi:DNA polymerase-1
VLLAVDGDGLLYRAFHGIGSDGETDADGRPVAAIRGLLSFVASAAARVRPDALIVGFDSRVEPVRKADFPAYKGHRPQRPDDLLTQLDDAPGLLAVAGVPVARIEGYEADDVLASAAALGRRERWHTVLVTSDRDSFALIDSTTSVLRLTDEGIDGSPILDPVGVFAAYGVTPSQYRDYAALRGDVSDNLRGVHGIGVKNAERLLAAFGSVAGVYAALDSGSGDGGRADEVLAIIGRACADRLCESETRVLVARNQRLMAMYDDLALPLPDELRLPLDPQRLRTALRSRSIGLNSSLWALVGAAAPPWTPGGFDKAPKTLPGPAPATPWARPPMPTWEEIRRRAEEAAALLRTAAVPARTAHPRTATSRGGRRPVPVLEGQLDLF